MEKVYITIGQISKKYGKTRQSVHHCIKRHNIDHKMEGHTIYVNADDYEKYRKLVRYSRKYSKIDDKLVFSKGEYSIPQAAKLLKRKAPALYFLVYSGKLKSIRKGIYHVIPQSEIDRLRVAQ